MLVVFSLAAIADWPGFTCVPLLLVAAYVARRPRVVINRLLVGLTWMLFLFCMTYSYLSMFFTEPNILLGALARHGGSGGLPVFRIPLYWGVRGMIYVLPPALILMIWGMVQSALAVKSKSEYLSGPETAILGFALSNLFIFFFLKEWAVEMAQLVLYWIPVASFWSAVVLAKWLSRPIRAENQISWRAILFPVTQILLSAVVIFVLSYKNTITRSDVEVGHWLHERLGGHEPLSLYVEHRGGDTNPVSFRYWTQREVNTMVKGDIEQAQGAYLFLPPELVEVSHLQREYRILDRYYRTPPQLSGLGSLAIRIYSAVLPERGRFFDPRSSYEGWVLMKRTGDS